MAISGEKISFLGVTLYILWKKFTLRSDVSKAAKFIYYKLPKKLG
jgi:hypothetical protein